MKKVVSGGPMRTVAFPQADAGLPDTTFFISDRPSAGRNPTGIALPIVGPGTRTQGDGCLDLDGPRAGRPRPAGRPDRSRLRQAEDPAGLLVARLQLEGHGEVVGQPQGQRRQRLAEGEGMGPGLEMPGLVPARPAAGGGIQRGRLRRQRGVRLADQIEQVAVQVERPGRDQVDDRDRDPLLEQGRTLGHEARDGSRAGPCCRG